MKINGNAIRVGNILEFEGKLWVATKTQHTQPGKGGAYMQVEMKALLEGTKINQRFRSAETVERVHLDARPYQFLYAEGNDLVLWIKIPLTKLALPKILWASPLLSCKMEWL